MAGFQDDPVEAEQRIRFLYAWVATHGNDGEGIISGIYGPPGGRMATPLVTSKRHLAERLRPVAEEAVEMSKQLSDIPAVNVQLAAFRRIEPGAELAVAKALRLLLGELPPGVGRPETLALAKAALAVMEPGGPEKHYDWAARRALELLDAGELEQAATSFGSDMTKHDETLRFAYELGVVALTYSLAGNAEGFRTWMQSMVLA